MKQTNILTCFFLLVAHAPGVALAGYDTTWREQRRFGLMTLRNFGLGKQSMEERINDETHYIITVLEKNIGKCRPSWRNPLQNPGAYPDLGNSKSFLNGFNGCSSKCHRFSSFPGKPMNPQLLFHKAASNIICQVLFAKHFDYEDQLLDFYANLFQETSKIINGPSSLVSHYYYYCCCYHYYYS